MNIGPYDTSANECNIITVFRMVLTLTESKDIFSADSGTYGRYYGIDDKDRNITTTTTAYSLAVLLDQVTDMSESLQNND